MQNKHEGSVKAIQDTIDKLIEKFGRRLIISCSMAIMGKDHEAERVEILQWGAKEVVVLLLKDTVDFTQDEENDFIGNENKPRTIN